MIKSITFPLCGKGYLYEKFNKPVKPSKDDRKYIEYGKRYERLFNEEKYNQDLETYKEELKIYNKHKNEFALPCSKNLIGTKYAFESNKINLIFGPNASGKSTIIKALAGQALTQDGFTRLLEPYCFKNLLEDDYDISECISKHAKNTCVVEWDGTPIYFHNFENKESHTHVFGELSGSILKSESDEFLYAFSKDKVSLGQKSIFFINRLFETAKTMPSMEDIIKPYLKKAEGYNTTWKKCYKAQEDYFKQFSEYASHKPITMLFDELDKSLDIETVWLLYTKVLPELVKQTGVQVIIISHNPLVMTENIFNNPMYNIISIDEDYTKDMKQMLNNVKF